MLGWEDPQSRQWKPTPVFLPGKSHGQKSLVGYSPWGCKELDTTEHTHTHTHTHTPHTIPILILGFQTEERTQTGIGSESSTS